jgi:tetratricopeptide (TPR) repeat protein
VTSSDSGTGVPSGGAIDREHPWPGLASFTEAMRPYFYGRDAEIAELARRVQRRLLTVLFGQSGLGKTSLLRAGLVPRLREAGYCPLVVRIDYSAEAPSPSAQVKAAILAATHDAGAWTKPGVATEDESLWEFLHHRDDVLRDAAGHALTPLLILDQFEEVFTLAQGDAAGRQRAHEFLGELADLCENRAPAALEARLDADESLAGRFDFTRGDYRVLIALREDYLAQLESLKGSMPSVTQNRMRIARMSGAEALAAVTGPGRDIVDDGVARAIVRFVAGSADAATADVEPALLSLVCRELNVARLARGQDRISADVLAGSHDTILSEFYERTLADQPPGVRRFIEDTLVTESGYRESVAEERVQRAFSAAGAPGALEALVDRRLLRIEERLDRRRVELTHDVLCGIVVASRDQRHEREALERAEAQLAEQRAQARAARKALVRARKIAAGSAVLAVLAIAGSLFGYFSMRRAQHAEALATTTRQEAEVSRGEAEKLVTFLLDDFQRELEPLGRLDIVADLARQAVAYYDALPVELRTPDTQRNRALALIRYGSAVRKQWKLDEADKALAEGVGILAALRASGDASEATAIGYSMGLATQASLAVNRRDSAKSLAASTQAVEVLRPLMDKGTPSLAARRAYGTALTILGNDQIEYGSADDAVKTLERARDIDRGIAIPALTDAPAAVDYAMATSRLAITLHEQGREDEATRLAQEAIDVTTRLLGLYPGYADALGIRAITSNALAFMVGPGHLREAEAHAAAGVRDYETLLRVDPTNGPALANLPMDHDDRALFLWQLGRIDEARAEARRGVEVAKISPPSPVVGHTLVESTGYLMDFQAGSGHRAEAEATIAEQRKFRDMAAAGYPVDSPQHALEMAWPASYSIFVPWDNWEWERLRADAKTAIASLLAMQPQDRAQAESRRSFLLRFYTALGDAELRLGDPQAAQAAVDEIRALYAQMSRPSPPEEVFEHAGSLLAVRVAVRLGHKDEARRLIEPALAREREAIKQRMDNNLRRLGFARMLYAAALAGGGASDPRLAEAEQVLGSLSPGFQQVRNVLLLRADIAALRAGHPWTH